MVMPEQNFNRTAPKPLANALRELAFRCAEEGWHAQARTLLNEAQFVANKSTTSNGHHDAPRVGPGRCSLKYDVTQFGRFQITRNGALLGPYNSKRAIWVLRYLLTTDRHIAHKGEIATRLWPNSPTDRAYHSLHVAVGALRTYLDQGMEHVILYANDRYMINDEISVRDDSVLFQTLIENGDAFLLAEDPVKAELAFDTAISLYTGDYDVVGLDFEWAMEEQRRHSAAMLHALDRSGSIAFKGGRFEKAASRFRRLLHCDPYREDVLAHLMVAYSRLGRRGDAVREFARCVQLLKCELGVEPSAELMAVYRNLFGNEPRPLPPFGSHQSTMAPSPYGGRGLTPRDDYLLDA
jgi:DNA-binding SARP family transcriptional activator